jgi:hypothetical protein
MIRHAMLAVATVAALGVGGAYAETRVAANFNEQARLTPQRIIIGLDISRSNPLVADPAFAAKVGARIADQIARLGFASEVHVRTLGNYDASSNAFYYDAILSVRNRPEDVATEVGRLVSGTPLLVKRGRWKAQGHTNILAFLDNARESIGCAGMPTTIILASDGIEDSEYAHLARRNAHLPAPDGREFAGCVKLEILGLGQGTRSPIETVRLRKEWTGWAKAAGFGEFQGLNDW